MNKRIGRLLVALAVAGVLVVVLPAVAGAATVSVQSGELRYTAAAGERNAPTLATDSDFLIVSDPNVLIKHGPGCLVGAPSHQVACDPTAATSARADLGDRADTLTVDASLPFGVTGHGGDGDDVLRGGAHADTLFGEGGNDKLDGRGSPDTMVGGSGVDTADYSSRTNRVVVQLDNAVGDGETNENDNVHADVENVVGGAGPDTLIGSGAANTLSGGGSNDFLQGLGGADTLDGGGGSVNTVSYEDKANAVHLTIDGAADDGTAGEHDNVTHVQNIFGGAGADTLAGNSETNMIWGGKGNDTLRGLGGKDILFGEEGADTLDGGDGADDAAVYTDAGADVFASNDGVANDGVSGERDNVEPSVENIVGGPFDDHLIGDNQVNSLEGREGNDTLEARGGADHLLGGIGDDWITGDDGNDDVNAGAGNDTVLLGTGNDLARWDTGDGNDTVEGREDSDTLQLVGSAAGESIALAGNGSRLKLSDGSEVNDVDGIETVDVRAEGGEDQLNVGDLTGTAVKNAKLDLAGTLGGTDDDDEVDSITLDGTAGPDTVQVSTGSGKVVVGGLPAQVDIAHAANAQDDLRIFPQEGDDRLTVGFEVPKQIHLETQGGPDHDTVVARGTANAESFTVFASGSFATITDPVGGFSAIAETVELDGLGGDDVIAGRPGLASLGVAIKADGGDGNDKLTGGDGADTLLGGAGTDAVDGDDGDDVAALGDGSDTFTWNAGDGNDKVDGQGATDTLQFNGSGVNENVNLSASGGRLQLTRDIGAVTLDVGGVENVDVDTTFGADTLTVNDLTGTGVNKAGLDLGQADAAIDKAIVNATNGDDAITVAGDATNGVDVTGLHPAVSIAHPEAANDQLRVNTLAGNDTVDFSGLAPNTIQTFQT